MLQFYHFRIRVLKLDGTFQRSPTDYFSNQQSKDHKGKKTWICNLVPMSIHMFLSVFMIKSKCLSWNIRTSVICSCMMGETTLPRMNPSTHAFCVSWIWARNTSPVSLNCLERFITLSFLECSPWMIIWRTLVHSCLYPVSATFCLLLCLW